MKKSQPIIVHCTKSSIKSMNGKVWKPTIVPKIHRKNSVLNTIEKLQHNLSMKGNIHTNLCQYFLSIVHSFLFLFNFKGHRPFACNNKKSKQLLVWNPSEIFYESKKNPLKEFYQCQYDNQLTIFAKPLSFLMLFFSLRLVSVSIIDNTIFFVHGHVTQTQWSDFPVSSKNL